MTISEIKNKQKKITGRGGGGLQNSRGACEVLLLQKGGGG